MSIDLATAITDSSGATSGVLTFDIDDLRFDRQCGWHRDVTGHGVAFTELLKITGRADVQRWLNVRQT